jgi:hypothetical protein
VLSHRRCDGGRDDLVAARTASAWSDDDHLWTARACPLRARPAHRWTAGPHLSARTPVASSPRSIRHVQIMRPVHGLVSGPSPASPYLPQHQRFAQIRIRAPFLSAPCPRSHAGRRCAIACSAAAATSAGGTAPTKA